MGSTRVVAALCSVVVAGAVAVPAPAAEARRGGTEGLWPTGFAAQQAATDCGEWRLDPNGFCVANDARNGLELGVRFQAATQLAITGVRIYRVDRSPVRGSLWDAAGNLLARGDFPTPPSDTGWQDMAFAQPVPIAPGTTYVASYFSPETKYAFSYEYFATAARTVGAVTALQSTEGEPNGVHCYQGAACGSFPVRGHRSSSYWVTPLWQSPDVLTPGTPPPGPTEDRTAPRVADGTPDQGAPRGRVGPRTKVTMTFSEQLRRSTLTRATVRLLRARGKTPVRARLRYDADRARVVLMPRRALAPSTAYRVQVTTRVRDLAGNRLDQVPGQPGRQPATWTFRTR